MAAVLFLRASASQLSIVVGALLPSVYREMNAKEQQCKFFAVCTRVICFVSAFESMQGCVSEGYENAVFSFRSVYFFICYFLFHENWPSSYKFFFTHVLRLASIFAAVICATFSERRTPEISFRSGRYSERETWR